MARSNMSGTRSPNLRFNVLRYPRLAMFFIGLLLSVHVNATSIQSSPLTTRSIPHLGVNCNLIVLRYGLNILLPLILVGSTCEAASSQEHHQQQPSQSHHNSLESFASSPSFTSSNKSNAVSFDSIIKMASNINYFKLNSSSIINSVNGKEKLSEDTSRSSKNVVQPSHDASCSGMSDSSSSCSEGHPEEPRVAASSYRGASSQKGQCIC